MKNPLAIIGFVLFLVSIILAIYAQFASLEPWTQYVSSVGAILFGFAGLIRPPRGLAMFVVIAAGILTFWHLLANYGL